MCRAQGKATDAHVSRRRLEAQGISAPWSRPEQVVASLGAVQAQDYLGALWAVGLRLRSAVEQDVEKALADRRIVRTWPMRGTLHFVAAADVRWMTELLAPRPAAAARGRFRSLGLDERLVSRAERVLVKHLEGGRRLTRPDAFRVLQQAKIATDAQRGLHLLWRLAHDGLVCFGPRAGRQHTFVLLHEWLPRAKSLPREEALAELARRYFTGHGPATLRDFVWWSGLKVVDARLAIALAGKAIEEETPGGQSSWCGPCAARQGARGTRVHLLPAFDELLVGYADRTAALHPAHKTYVNTGGGILNPTLVVDDRVVGTWKRRIDRGHLVFSPTPFAPLDQTTQGALELAVKRYARFLGLRVGQP